MRMPHDTLLAGYHEYGKLDMSNAWNCCKLLSARIIRIQPDGEDLIPMENGYEVAVGLD